MPRFYFDYRDGNGLLERDEAGIEFPSLEAACFDARLVVIGHVRRGSARGTRTWARIF